MSGQRGFAEYQNISAMFGVIIARDKATLHELETVYSYEDAMTLAEILMVGNYNEWIAQEAAKDGDSR